MKHYEVVCAVIYNDKNEILILKRGPGRALCGFWEFPGGKLEENESKEETIKREIKEELECDIKPIKYLGSSLYEYKNLKPYDDFSIMLYAYKCLILSDSFKLTEHTDYAWVKKDELINYEFASADIKILEYL